MFDRLDLFASHSIFTRLCFFPPRIKLSELDCTNIAVFASAHFFFAVETIKRQLAVVHAVGDDGEYKQVTQRAGVDSLLGRSFASPAPNDASNVHHRNQSEAFFVVGSIGDHRRAVR